MAETLPSPLRLRLRASRPSSFSRFQTLFVHSISQSLFSEPVWYRNANATPNFGPLRSAKTRTRSRTLSKSDSDSDFSLISSVERSDGSIVFRFGNAKDYEAMVASIDVDKADLAATEDLENADGETTSEHVISYSERQQRSYSAQASGEVKTVLDEDSSVVDSVSKGMSESTVSLLEETAIDTKANDLSCSNSNVDEFSVDDNKEVVAAKDTSLEVNKVLNEANGSEIDEKTASICEDGVIADSVSSELNQVLNEANGGDVDEKTASICEDGVIPDSMSSELNKVPNEANGSDIDEKTASICEDGLIADSVTSELDPGSDVSENSAAPACSKESADAEVVNFAVAGTDNGNVNAVANISTETPAEVSLDEETSLGTFDGHVDADDTDTSMQLGHSASSSIGEEVGVSKPDTSSVEELPIPGVVEPHSIEDTPNREEMSTGGFALSSGAVLLRNPSEGLTGADDAYFVAENWLGVADGVGQWSFEGISDGLYAQELMENCERIVSHCNGSQVKDPGEVLVRSVAETESPGSSTILVSHFDGQAFQVANVGDSGFMIIRNGAVFQQSSPVVHEFNFPYHVESGDDPSEHMEAYKIDLNEGDVIITSTDGLFDNLYDHDIVSIVSESLEAGVKPQDIAESLASKAQELGRSSSSRSPFADAAQAAGYSGYSGGKLDDVVVIVSLVQKKPLAVKT